MGWEVGWVKNEEQHAIVRARWYRSRIVGGFGGRVSCLGVRVRKWAAYDRQNIVTHTKKMPGKGLVLKSYMFVSKRLSETKEGQVCN